MIKKVFLNDIIEKPITGEWGDEGNSVKVLRTTNFTNEGRLDFSKVVLRDIEKKKVDSKRLIKGDIIIEKSGGSPTQPVGRVVYFEAEGTYLTNNFTAVLRPIKEQVYPKYLHYILFTNHKFGFTSAYQNKTTGIINLQLSKYVDGLQIPLPPLSVQQKIAAILDAADELRQKDKALVAKYDELTQALFLDMFGDPVSNPKGWEIMYLEDVSDEIVDCPHSTPPYIDKITEFPCIRTTELKNGNIDWSKMKYLDENSYLNRVKRLVPEAGDIVYGREGTFGEAAIIPPNCKMSLGQRVMLFRPNKEIVTSTFLHSIVRSKSVYNQALKVNIGATVGHVNVKDVKKFRLIVPSLVLQNQFGEGVKAIEEQKSIAQKSALKSEELFNSLLQQAFNGELV
jgi:type I restriction enzyme S subunit